MNLGHHYEIVQRYVLFDHRRRLKKPSPLGPLQWIFRNDGARRTFFGVPKLIAANFATLYRAVELSVAR
ncbi:MAG: hypothetical protein ACYC1I_12775 [Acidimicrobiales bacterium]